MAYTMRTQPVHSAYVQFVTVSGPDHIANPVAQT